MKITSRIFTLAAATFMCFQVAAMAKVEVVWTNPEKYVDIKDPFNGMQNTKEDAFYNIEKVLKRLAKKLPDGYLLKLDVTDLDLAGETQSRNFRVVRDMFPPRMEFSYQLLDGGDNVLAENQENIRDTSFMNKVSLRYKNEAYGFEKQLIEDWFKDSFTDYLVKN
ncbi:DUF3016 domain-containing protein [Paraglaciecola aquimarina]|uniref:DUF3016 domain-containing protein n=1 Tax=Paraglaciecola algarum TaxID=3050085 RepID=A0ABS9D8L4_9ALTE|nr:DUF3016 domain-containing protein [Paraglaciecola sp. G1-23]MCF2949135.1 DUF3016 domain-containing protein [Paraglaciecola sp. G1-23]